MQNMSTACILSFTSMESAEVQDPISIMGNVEFLSIAEQESWPGNGTVSNPIIIENLKFEPDGHRVFDLFDTDLYFIFRNNEIKGPRIDGEHPYPLPEY